MTKNSHIKSKNKKFLKFFKRETKESIERKKILKRLKINYIESPLSLAMIVYNLSNDNEVHRKTSYKVLERITLNFIRHKFTNYEILIKQLAVSGKSVSLIDFKRQVNKKIIEFYGKDFIKKEL